jgi:hypothetical protein
VKDLHKLCQEAPAGVGYDAWAILHLNQNSLVERNVLSKENKIMTSVVDPDPTFHHHAKIVRKTLISTVL